MTSAPSFDYITTDIPAGMTIAEYRMSHGRLGQGTRAGARRVRALSAAVLASAVLLVVPAVASASYYLSFKRAQTIAGRVIHITGSRTDRVWPGCWPSYRRHTAKNRHLTWHLWTCRWTGAFTKLADGSHYSCTGAVSIEGRHNRRGYAVRQLGPARCHAAPTAPPPTPPKPTPPSTGGGTQPPNPPSTGGGTPPSNQPSTGGGPAQQDIVNHTYQWATSVGSAQVSPVTSTYKFTVNGCTMIGADTGRCTVWRWVSDGITGYDGSGHPIYRVDFYRIYAFSQWLTTNGIYNDYTLEFDSVDPAQSCLVVSYGDHDGDAYGCTTLTPGP